MPKVIGQPDREQQRVNRALARWAEFDDPTQWKVSRKGNRYRPWEDRVVTICPCSFAPGRWSWCIADDLGTRFSRSTYATQEEAQRALGETLGLND